MSLPKSFITLALCSIVACSKPTPLTPTLAESIVRTNLFPVEPVYAEVPQRVWYGPKSPMDDFDQASVRTLMNLQKAGLVTVAESHSPDGMTTYQAKVTQKGFRILGTMPSARGPVYRGRIADKKLDTVRNFQRHPSDPTVGRAEVIWHYDDPTELYAMFETKIDKPLKKPFASIAAFHWDNGAWKMEITIKKTAPAS